MYHHNRKSIIVLINSKVNHTMKKRLMIIPIPKGCHMKITISIIVLEKERQKRIIIFRPKKYNEEQSRDNTYYEHNEK